MTHRIFILRKTFQNLRLPNVLLFVKTLIYNKYNTVQYGTNNKSAPGHPSHIQARITRFFLAKNTHSEYSSAMRIIAGSKRGMTLLSPKTQISRPITDRVKESLFSVLYKYDLPVDATVADLFSGVGSLGLEALSRGAKCVTFVEKDLNISAILKNNIERSGFVKESKIVRANAFAIGAPLRSSQDVYDLIFVDPPYAATMNTREGSALAGLMDILNDQVTNGGIVVVRTSHEVSLLERYGPFQIEEQRLWGTMNVTILSKTECDIPENDQ